MLIIIDALSAGRQYAQVLKERGLSCIHITSSAPITALLGKHNSDDFIANLTYTGNMDELITEIQQVTKLDAITAVLAGLESGVFLVDELSERLQLPTTNGSALSEARRNKHEMRKVVAEAGLAVPHFATFNNFVSLKSWVESVSSYPVVLKPLNSSGTDGVSICRDEVELRAGFDIIVGKNNIFGEKNALLLAESFLAGDEYVINSVSCDGKHRIVDVWKYNKKTVGAARIYDNEVLVDFNAPHVKALIDYTHRVLDALNIKYGPSHAEVMLTPTGPVLVEVGARLGGAVNMAVSQQCLGCDAVSLSVDAYIDPERFMREYRRPPQIIRHAMVVDIASSQSGIVERELLTEKLSGLPSLVKMQVKLKAGDPIKPTVDLLSSPANFHLVHEDNKQIMADYTVIQSVAKEGFLLRPALESTQVVSLGDVHQQREPLNQYIAAGTIFDPKKAQTSGTSESSGRLSPRFQ